MNARNKINAATIAGSVGTGLLLGWIMGSWLICIIIVVVVLALARQDNVIRFQPEASAHKPKTRRWYKRGD